MAYRKITLAVFVVLALVSLTLAAPAPEKVEQKADLEEGEQDLKPAASGYGWGGYGGYGGYYPSWGGSYYGYPGYGYGYGYGGYGGYGYPYGYGYGHHGYWW